jgi:hypothetical protein
MNVEIGAEAALFPEKEYIYGILVCSVLRKEKMRKNCRLNITAVECREFFYRESLAAGSLDQLPAPLERIPADA